MPSQTPLGANAGMRFQDSSSQAERRRRLFPAQGTAAHVRAQFRQERGRRPKLPKTRCSSWQFPLTPASMTESNVPRSIASGEEDNGAHIGHGDVVREQND